MGASGAWVNNQDGRHFNCTSVRYPINHNGFTNATNYATTAAAAASGTNNDSGTNFPLKSGHTGGIQVALGDGSVRFLSSTTALVTLSALCTRAGGEVNGNF
jgi:hypothetical protein